MRRVDFHLPLRLAPAVTLAVSLGPIIIGLIWTVLPSFGWLPAIGATRLSFQPWLILGAAPGFATAVRLTVSVGVATTVLALGLATGIFALRSAMPALRGVDRWLAPLMAAPHSAIALGLAFLLIPSGWLVRLVSPWLTGFDRPPAGIVTVQDPNGLALIAGLLLKEVPYLMLMMLAASAQLPTARLMAAAQSLGPAAPVAWLKAVFPQIYPQIRLPLFAVLAFSMSTVDMGLILAPANPPPLAILATRWFSDYDLSLYPPAAAAAVLQLAIAAASITVWHGLEWLAAKVARRWVVRGAPDRAAQGALSGFALMAMLALALGLLSIAVMALWSVSGSWWFPAALPTRFQLANWREQSGHLMETTGVTLAIGFSAVIVSLMLSLACLENEQINGRRPGATALWLVYLPLLVPQIAFLFGVQVALVRLGLDGTVLAVAWAHLIFVLPYVFLSLADPYRALDPRYAASAAALGAAPLAVFFRVKLPLLARPILVAIAVGFAVSVGQYLPTLFAGAGRVATLTTEAVTLAGGADRRVIGVFAVMQTSLPLLVYAAALAVPALLFRNRRELRR